MSGVKERPPCQARPEGGRLIDFERAIKGGVGAYGTGMEERLSASEKEFKENGNHGRRYYKSNRSTKDKKNRQPNVKWVF